MMLDCFLVHLISMLATVYIVLNDKMTVNVERSYVVAWYCPHSSKIFCVVLYIFCFV